MQPDHARRAPHHAGFVRGVSGDTPVIRVLVAEDVRVLRDTLVAVLMLEDDLEVVAELASGDRIVPAALEHRPDVAVLDIGLPVVDGLTAAAELHERLPQCRTLILTGLGWPGNLRRALLVGASGFMVKEGPVDALLDALRRVARGDRFIDPHLARAALDIGGEPLPAREADLLRRSAAGDGWW